MGKPNVSQQKKPLKKNAIGQKSKFKNETTENNLKLAKGVKSEFSPSKNNKVAISGSGIPKKINAKGNTPNKIIPVKEASSSDEGQSDEIEQSETEDMMGDVEAEESMSSASEEVNGSEEEASGSEEEANGSEEVNGSEELNTSEEVEEKYSTDEIKTVNKPIARSFNINRLYMTNVSLNTRFTDVLDFFEKYEIIKVSLETADDFQREQSDKNTLSGYITFANSKEAEKAIELNGMELNGQKIRLCTTHWRNIQANEQSNTQSHSIFLRSVLIATNKEIIRDFFQVCGKILNISFKPSLINKGYKNVTVTFENEEGVTQALKLNGSKLNDMEEIDVCRFIFRPKPYGHPSQYPKQNFPRHMHQNTKFKYPKQKFPRNMHQNKPYLQNNGKKISADFENTLMQKLEKKILKKMAQHKHF